MFSITDRWNRTMSCGTTAIAARRLSWVTAVTGWPSIRTSPHRTSSSRWTSATSVDLPAPDGPARPTFWPAGTRRLRPAKTGPPPGWAKVTSRNSIAPPAGTKGLASRRAGAGGGHEGPRAGAVGDGVRPRDPPQGLADDGELLGRRDQGQRQVARAVQDAEGERAHHHHLAGRDPAQAPEVDGPGQHAAGHHPERQVVDDPGPLEVRPAPGLRPGLGSDEPRDAAPLPLAGREGLARPDVRDRVDQLAAALPGPLGVGAVE